MQRIFFIIILLINTAFARVKGIELLCYTNRCFQLNLLDKLVSRPEHGTGSYANQSGTNALFSGNYITWKSNINSFYNELASRRKTTNERIAEKNKFKYHQLYQLDKQQLDRQYKNKYITASQYRRRLFELRLHILKGMQGVTAARVKNSGTYIKIIFVLFLLFIVAAVWYYNRSTRPPAGDCIKCGCRECVDKMLIGKRYFYVCRYCGWKTEVHTE
ncbi:MAG TPA: hypothetical protein VKS21_02955 [Spirochaetota bacterium]|nr:hypothetical protein [Spirochaetota bacterium]